MTLRPGERLVIDASVAVKWVVPEPDSDRAEALLDHALGAPDLLFAECANVLWKKVRRGELSKDEADIGAQTLEQADIAIASTRGHLASAMAIAVELDLPAYESGVGLRVIDARNSPWARSPPDCTNRPDT